MDANHPMKISTTHMKTLVPKCIPLQDPLLLFNVKQLGFLWSHMKVQAFPSIVRALGTKMSCVFFNENNGRQVKMEGKDKKTPTNCKKHLVCTYTMFHNI